MKVTIADITKMDKINLLYIPDYINFKVHAYKGNLELKAYNIHSNKVRQVNAGECILVQVPYSPVKQELKENLLNGAETLFYLIMYTVLFNHCPINLLGGMVKDWNTIIERVESRL